MQLVDYVALIAGTGFAVVGLLFVLSGVQHYFDGRRITAQEVTPIGRLESGPVAIAGTARPASEGVLSAPFTDRDCVAFTYRVKETDGKDRSEPFIAEGTESVPFYVEDGTGEVLVRPEAADIELERGTEIIVKRDEQPPETIERFLSRRDDIGEPTEPLIEALWPGVGTRSFRERLLAPGDKVYVFGDATRRPSREFDDTDIEVTRGAEGGHAEPRTFIVSNQPKEAVSGGHRSGGRLAVVIGVFLIVIGAAFVASTPLV